MKKIISAALLIIMTAALSACSSPTEAPKLLSAEGVAPYELSESEEYLLQSFGMMDTSQILVFKAPREAISLKVNVYRLGEDATWQSISSGGISIGTNREPTDRLSGSFTLQLRENYALDYIINSNGAMSYKTDELVLNSDTIASTKTFLSEFHKITMNTEIPVALLVYDSGSSMSSHSLQDFFEPATFAEMDLVQAVTLEFSDKELMPAD